MTIERGTLVGYRVKVIDENGLKVLWRYDYTADKWLSDENAKAAAQKAFDFCIVKNPHDIVELIELRTTCVVVECGVLKTSAE